LKGKQSSFHRKAFIYRFFLQEGASAEDLLKTVNERQALLKLTSNAMVKAASDFVQVCRQDGKRWIRLMENERELRTKFEDMIEQYAHQHSSLEAQMKKELHLSEETEATTEASATDVAASSPSTKVSTLKASTSKPPTNYTSGSDDDDDFHDAVDELDEVFTVTAPPSYGSPELRRSESSSKEDEPSDDDETCSSVGNQIHIVKKGKSDAQGANSNVVASASTASRKLSQRQRRRRVPDRPNQSISLWNIIKNSIGKDLTKIPVPVNFSEPLSMLQRLTEDYEYAEILHQAASIEDDCEQMAFVAAFTVSSYSTTAIRTTKPFNPLLGETFEFDRSDDKGWRCVSEQVSHHPPIVAQFCESTQGEAWQCWQEFSMRSKFKGKYLEVEPLGIAHLVFPKSGNHYTWRKVKTVVHNIVLGKLWIDQHGEMSVVNHAKGIKCHMKFEPYSYFGGTPKKVTGTVTNAKAKVEWVLNGTWDAKIEAAKVLNETVVKGKSTMEIGPTK